MGVLGINCYLNHGNMSARLNVCDGERVHRAVQGCSGSKYDCASKDEHPCPSCSIFAQRKAMIRGAEQVHQLVAGRTWCVAHICVSIWLGAAPSCCERKEKWLA
jgi:hypothetical protein